MTLGNAIKFIGAIVGVFILVGASSAANSQFGGGGGFAFAGLVIGAVVGGLFWVCGILVAAQGQILRATLDTAVSSSHFLTDSERAEAMGLPAAVAARVRG